MAGFSGKLGRKQEAAILALLSTRTVEEAARVVHISPRTLYRWQKEPEFDAASGLALHSVSPLPVQRGIDCVSHRSDCEVTAEEAIYGDGRGTRVSENVITA
jgi:Helix-turn-helix domain